MDGGDDVIRYGCLSLRSPVYACHYRLCRSFSRLYGFRAWWSDRGTGYTGKDEG